MLVLALIFVALGVLIFILEAIKPGVIASVNTLSLGLASGFAGIACWLIDILQAQGKL